jgi:hypothetical protein
MPSFYLQSKIRYLKCAHHRCRYLSGLLFELLLFLIQAVKYTIIKNMTSYMILFGNSMRLSNHPITD